MGAAHVALVGLSGTGKSTVGPMVAARTGRVSVDLDRIIEEETGADISELFAREGESGFRARELEALRAAVAGPPAVVATGGGIVTIPAAASLLAERTTVVWLRAEPQTLTNRLRGTSEERPLLSGDATAALVRLAAERDPLYERAADLALDVGSAAPTQVAESVVEQLGERRP